MQAEAREGFATQGAGEEKQASLQSYLEKKMAALAPVDEGAVDRFYEQQKEQMGGQTKESVAPMIKAMLGQKQRHDLLGKLIGDLRNQSKIEINQKLLQQLATVANRVDKQSEKDFRKAVAGSKPMVVDFGANSRIPCRQLRPILEKVRTE